MGLRQCLLPPAPLGFRGETNLVFSIVIMPSLLQTTQVIQLIPPRIVGRSGKQTILTGCCKIVVHKNTDNYIKHCRQVFPPVTNRPNAVKAFESTLLVFFPVRFEVKHMLLRICLVSVRLFPRSFISLAAVHRIPCGGSILWGTRRLPSHLFPDTLLRHPSFYFGYKLLVK